VRSTSYVALGDSMSINLYPQIDIRERLKRVEPTAGAAALLFRNVDSLWPEFSGKDLRTRFPELHLQNHASDGATINAVTDEQLPEVTDPAGVSLATLTAGGNDLLGALALASEGADALRREVADIQHRFSRLVTEIRTALPNALLIIATIYDPTDGTGLLWRDREPLPIELLTQINEHIRAVTRATTHAVLADVNLHFLGHGIHVAEAESWYWRPSPIEPSARGASEIRRVFWNAFSAARR